MKKIRNFFVSLKNFAGKMIPLFAFWQGLRAPYGLNYVAKKATV